MSRATAAPSPRAPTRSPAGAAQLAADGFRLVADPVRLAILRYLAGGEQCVGAICEHAGISQPAISHHIAALRLAGMVESRRGGKQVFYRIVPEAVGAMIAELEELKKGGGA